MKKTFLKRAEKWMGEKRLVWMAKGMMDLADKGEQKEVTRTMEKLGEKKKAEFAEKAKEMFKAGKSKEEAKTELKKETEKLFVELFDAALKERGYALTFRKLEKNGTSADAAKEAKSEGMSKINAKLSGWVDEAYAKANKGGEDAKTDLGKVPEAKKEDKKEAPENKKKGDIVTPSEVDRNMQTQINSSQTKAIRDAQEKRGMTEKPAGKFERDVDYAKNEAARITDPHRDGALIDDYEGLDGTSILGSRITSREDNVVRRSLEGVVLSAYIFRDFRDVGPSGKKTVDELADAIMKGQDEDKTQGKKKMIGAVELFKSNDNIVTFDGWKPNIDLDKSMTFDEVFKMSHLADDMGYGKYFLEAEKYDVKSHKIKGAIAGLLKFTEDMDPVNAELKANYLKYLRDTFSSSEFRQKNEAEQLSALLNIRPLDAFMEGGIEVQKSNIRSGALDILNKMKGFSLEKNSQAYKFLTALKDDDFNKLSDNDKKKFLEGVERDFLTQLNKYLDSENENTSTKLKTTMEALKKLNDKLETKVMTDEQVVKFETDMNKQSFFYKNNLNSFPAASIKQMVDLKYLEDYKKWLEVQYRMLSEIEANKIIAESGDVKKGGTGGGKKNRATETPGPIELPKKRRKGGSEKGGEKNTEKPNPNYEKLWKDGTKGTLPDRLNGPDGQPYKAEWDAKYGRFVNIRDRETGKPMEGNEISLGDTLYLVGDGEPKRVGGDLFVLVRKSNGVVGYVKEDILSKTDGASVDRPKKGPTENQLPGETSHADRINRIMDRVRNDLDSVKTGASFSMPVDMQMVNFRVDKSGGGYSLKYAYEGRNYDMPFASIDAMKRYFISREFERDLNLNVLGSREFFKNFRNERLYKPYSKYDIGELASGPKQTGNVVEFELDWERSHPFEKGNAYVTVTVGSQGFMTYRIKRRDVNPAGGDVYEGHAVSISEMVQKIALRRKWVNYVENMEPGQIEAVRRGQQVETGMYEIQTFNDRQSQIGKPVYFYVDTLRKETYLALKWGSNENVPPDSYQNPQVRINYHGNGRMSYVLIVQNGAGGKPRGISGNVDSFETLFAQLGDIKNREKSLLLDYTDPRNMSAGMHVGQGVIPVCPRMEWRNVGGGAGGNGGEKPRGGTEKVETGSEYWKSISDKGFYSKNSSRIGELLKGTAGETANFSVDNNSKTVGFGLKWGNGEVPNEKNPAVWVKDLGNGRIGYKLVTMTTASGQLAYDKCIRGGADSLQGLISSLEAIKNSNGTMLRSINTDPNFFTAW